MEAPPICRLPRKTRASWRRVVEAVPRVSGARPQKAKRSHQVKPVGECPLSTTTSPSTSSLWYLCSRWFLVSVLGSLYLRYYGSFVSFTASERQADRQTDRRADGQTGQTERRGLVTAEDSHIASWLAHAEPVWCGSQILKNLKRGTLLAMFTFATGWGPNDKKAAL